MREVCQRCFAFVQILGERLAFICDERLGYLANCPSNIGTAMRASVHVRLPLLEPEVLRQLARQSGLQVRGQYGEHDSLDPRRPCDISNRRRLGATEVELINELYEGLTRLITYHGGCAMLDLGGVPLFAQLSRVDIARLLPEFDEVALAAGELLFAQGEPGDALYIVREGTLCADVQPLRRHRDAGDPRPGRVIGEVALLSDQPRTASIRAVTAATLWRLSRRSSTI